MGKDMDRDLSEQLTDLISQCITLLETINDNKYVPHIITQPSSVVGDIDDTVSFTVIANNVKGYQWQYSSNNGTTWNNTSQPGNKTATLTTTVASGRYNWLIRCQITGLDNSVIYTDNVRILRPET